MTKTLPWGVFAALAASAGVASAQPAPEGSRAAAAPPQAGPVEPLPRSSRLNDSFALGFAVHRFQDDFGLGALASSPSFLDGLLRITLGGGVAWYPHAIGDEGFESWKAYGHTRVVLESGMRISATPLRGYGFGGPTALFLPGGLSSKAVRVGGVGGVGFEARWRNIAQGGDGPVSYFVELGGIGTGASANRLPARPLFANGFLISVGMRAYF